MALSGSCQTSTWYGETTSGKLIFNWTATQNQSNNTSTISWNIKASVTSGWIYYSELRVNIKANGAQSWTSLYYRSSDNHTQCSNGTQLASGTKTITHNADGTCSFIIDIGAGIYASSINETGSGSFTINPHTIYTLSVSAGTGSSITVNRTSSGYASTGNITNGARLYKGDKLKITFSASSGYGLSTHTVNGTNFTSGGTHTVSGNTSVVSKALAKYTLSISAGTGSTITVNRTSSGVGSVGNLNNGAVIYKGDKLKITFSANTNYEILTHTVNNTSFVSGNTHTVSSNVSVVSTARMLASSVGATNADIESVSTITVTKHNDDYWHTIQYSFVGLSGYIDSAGNTSDTEVRFKQTSIPFTVPASFYSQIPNSKNGTCTITCKTYESETSATQLGSSTTCTFNVTANSSLCDPIVSGTVVDINDVTIALTGNSSTLVRYKSNAECTITASSRNSASITSMDINGVIPTEIGGEYKTVENNVQNASFVFNAVDSRGYSKTVTAHPTVIEYVLLTCNPTIVRETPTSNTLDIYISGNYFRGSFGSVTNTLEISYQYKETSSASWSAVTQVFPTVSYGNSTYSTSFQIVLQDQYAYQKSYDIRVYVSDGRVTVDNNDVYLTTLLKQITIPRGIPVFDWGQSDFNMNVDMNVNGKVAVTSDVDIGGDLDVASDIKLNGSSIVVKQKLMELSDVPITTQSTRGAYFCSPYVPADYGITGTIIGLMVRGWTRASASFVPYLESSGITIMSDVSQTVGTVKLLVTYL